MGSTSWPLAPFFQVACAARSQIRAGFWSRPIHVAPGQGLVEYALILVLVAVIAIGSLMALGNRTDQVFEQVHCTLSGGTYHTDSGEGNSGKCK